MRPAEEQEYREFLIVRYERTLGPDDARRLKDRLQERLPGVDVLLIGCQQLAVYRPEPTP